MAILCRNFYTGNTVDIARSLVDCYLVRRYEGQLLVCRITETEAYVGAIDKAAPSYGYHKTARNATMFGPPGHAYIYLIYGMHCCLNFVTEPEGEPSAVLLRGLAPVHGLEALCRLLQDLGERSQVEDLQSFAEVFLTVKRTGGDLLHVIRNTVSCIRQKQETVAEIETVLTGKMTEQKVMSLMPLLILLYVRLTSPEFLSGMYGNLTGRAVMTVCLLIYAVAYLWGKKIVGIEV